MLPGYSILEYYVKLVASNRVDFARSSVPTVIFGTFGDVTRITPEESRILPIAVHPSKDGTTITKTLIFLLASVTNSARFLSRARASDYFVGESDLGVSPRAFSPFFSLAETLWWHLVASYFTTSRAALSSIVRGPTVLAPVSINRQ